MFRFINLLILILVVANTASANTGLQFLTFSQYPRGTALGEAFTAGYGDLTASAFNPAGLAKIDKIQLAIMHNSWFLDIYSNQAGVALPAGENVFSLGLTWLTVPGIQIRDAASSQPLGESDAQDMALSLGWSRVIKGFSAGLAGKFLYEKIHLNSATGWAADLGAQYQYRNYSFGASVLNWGPDLKFVTEDFSIPTQFRAGVAYQPQKEFLQGQWLLLADAVKPKSLDAYLNFGIEASFLQQYKVRLGYKSAKDNQSNFSFGAGIKYKRYLVDYAFVPFKENLGSSHQIALIVEL
jgi:hypothetical protein